MSVKIFNAHAKHLPFPMPAASNIFHIYISDWHSYQIIKKRFFSNIP